MDIVQVAKSVFFQKVIFGKYISKRVKVTNQHWDAAMHVAHSPNCKFSCFASQLQFDLTCSSVSNFSQDKCCTCTCCSTLVIFDLGRRKLRRCTDSFDSSFQKSKCRTQPPVKLLSGEKCCRVHKKRPDAVVPWCTVLMLMLWYPGAQSGNTE